MNCETCQRQIFSHDGTLRLACGHQFHWACVYPMIKTRDACPKCPLSQRVGGGGGGDGSVVSAALQTGSDPDYEQALEVSFGLFLMTLHSSVFQ